MLDRAPHPIPYQGSKRRLAPAILACAPAHARRLIEPFAGSGALTLSAARAGRADAFVLGDALAPLAGLWQVILAEPRSLADRYERIWRAQADDPRGHYLRTRSAFNRDGDPARLLYLLARCVKNAVRFNPSGEFNQSADHRRAGMRPEKMRRELEGAHRLLAGRARAVHADYRALLDDAGADDLVYLDPPWQGVSGVRDTRYAEQLDLGAFVASLERLNTRGVRFLVSFDGRTGAREFGEPLPRALSLTRVRLHAGRSSQATLAGRSEMTVESLYLSPALARTLDRTPRDLHVGA